MNHASLLVILAGSLAACGPAMLSSATTPRVPANQQAGAALRALEGEWTLSMTQTGGIMGRHRSIEIAWDGKMTATEYKPKKKTVSEQFGADQMSHLRTLVSQSSYTPPATRMDCRDCFVYDVEITSGSTKPFSARVDDTNLDASGVRSLVTFLTDLMQRSLK